MIYVTNNINIRKAQIGLTVQDMAVASDISRQQIHNVIANPEKAMFRSLAKIAVLLYCPVELLLQSDPGLVVDYPLPPKGYLEHVRENLQKYGFNGGTVITVEELARELDNRYREIA